MMQIHMEISFFPPHFISETTEQVVMKFNVGSWHLFSFGSYRSNKCNTYFKQLTSQTFIAFLNTCYYTKKIDV
jgi:hypothetical protein